MNGIILKGARRIIFEELQRALAQGEEPSITDLADVTCYSETTVKAVIGDLVRYGVIKATRPGRGCKYSYQILKE